MASIVPGFEYDIFISYRHKDNKGDQWVTEFINSLKTELEATFKDDISIYFDVSPHDGLLETHNVDKSLEGKLNCLVFVPIISQTYCDPKSFAWQHEFCAFNQLAKADQFGRDIRLTNGNVASRILPIKIHDLDTEDKALLENELGGVLRAIEFIYKETGVNRPLRSNEENPTRNQNQTTFRNQVNKVANAIKEIILILKNPTPQSSLLPKNNQPATNHSKSKNKMAGILITIGILLLLLTGYFLYPRLFPYTKELAGLDKSIAILPFADMSPDHDQEYFGDGVAEEVINVLAQIPDLKVISRTSSFQFKGKNEDLRKIGEVLGVATILEGSVRKSKDKVRVTAQLIKTSDGSHLWSKTYDRNADDIFKVQDEIASEVVNALKITLSGNLKPTGHSTSNEEAYNVYLQARYFYDRVTGEGDKKALELFEQVVVLDSMFAPGWVGLSLCKWRLCKGNASCPDWEIIKNLTLKSLEIDPNLAEAHLNLALFSRSEYDYDNAQKEIIEAYRLEPKNSRILRNYGLILLASGKFDEAISLCKTAVALDPVQVNTFRYLGRVYYYAGYTKEAYDAYEKSYELNPIATPTIGRMEFYNTMLAIKGPAALLDKLTSEKDEVVKLTGTAIAQSIMKQPDASNKSLARLIENYSSQNAYEIAQVYAYRDDKENMFKWLQRAYDQKELSFVVLSIDPVFKAFRKEKRFVELVKHIKFPE